LLLSGAGEVQDEKRCSTSGAKPVRAEEGIAPLALKPTRDGDGGSGGGSGSGSGEDRLCKESPMRASFTLEDLNREFEEAVDAHFPEYAAVVKTADESFFGGESLQG